MRTRLSSLACLLAVMTLGLSALPANAASLPSTPQPDGEIVALLEQAVSLGSADAGAGRLPPATGRVSASSGSEGLRAVARIPTNFARLLARFAAVGDDPVRVHRELRRETSATEGLGDYVHIGPLRGRRFTVTVISDQACATVRRRPPGGVSNGPCTPADRRASLTPLQDSAEMLLLATRDFFEYEPRAGAAREVFNPFFLRYFARLIAPREVSVSAIRDTDRDGLDDDARLAFHANGKSVCTSLPLGAKASGRVTFGSCRRLRPREVEIRERARVVFREMKQGADIGASMEAKTLDVRVRRAARLARLFSSHPEAETRVMGDRVQFRARVNGHLRYACYHVSPDGARAAYSTSGRPGTWRLGRCR
jgi:hypothetical protein